MIDTFILVNYSPQRRSLVQDSSEGYYIVVTMVNTTIASIIASNTCTSIVSESRMSYHLALLDIKFFMVSIANELSCINSILYQKFGVDIMDWNYELTWKLNMHHGKFVHNRMRKTKSKEFYTHIVNMIWSGWLMID